MTMRARKSLLPDQTPTHCRTSSPQAASDAAAFSGDVGVSPLLLTNDASVTHSEMMRSSARFGASSSKVDSGSVSTRAMYTGRWNPWVGITVKIRKHHRKDYRAVVKDVAISVIRYFA